MGAEPVVQLHISPRSQLRQLDAALDALEDLNLQEVNQLPVRLGSALQNLGVADPYKSSVTELIDRIFELEEPVLARLRLTPRFARA